MKKTYYANCVTLPARAVSDMVDSGMEITRKTFLKHVDRESRIEVERSLGYVDNSLTIASDWAVHFFKGKLRGQEVVWIRYSSIEYVFK